MKKLLAIICTLTLSILLCSCANDKEKTTTSEVNTTKSEVETTTNVSSNIETSLENITDDSSKGTTTNVEEQTTQTTTIQETTTQEVTTTQPTTTKPTTTKPRETTTKKPEIETTTKKENKPYTSPTEAAMAAGYYNVATFVQDGKTGYAVMIHTDEGRISNLDNAILKDFLAEKGLKVNFTYGGLLTQNDPDCWFSVASPYDIEEMTEEEKLEYKTDKYADFRSRLYYTAEDGTEYYDDINANGDIVSIEKWTIKNGKVYEVLIRPEWLKDENGYAYYIKDDGTIVRPGFEYPFEY